LSVETNQFCPLLDKLLWEICRLQDASGCPVFRRKYFRATYCLHEECRLLRCDAV
jgi:hypothetical protein